jgi:hypothetical protein
VNPELMAAAAPKKVALRTTPSANRPATSADAARHIPAPPAPRGLVPPPRYAVSDSSMAGHQYTPVLFPPTAPSTVPSQLSPPKKVVGLIHRYDDEDALTCDDHHH